MTRIGLFILLLTFSLFSWADEDEGFKLSSKAIKNFELGFQKLEDDGPWVIPVSSLMHAGEEENLYRRRGDTFQRIDFKVLKKSLHFWTVESADLDSGDEVVISGVGFLRIAELAAYGGAPEGHSH